MIHVANVSFRYRSDAPVLRDVSLDVLPGDFVGIIGSNGSGKSTLMKLILHQCSPQSGRITLFGKEARSFTDWPQLGYVPQSHHYSGAAFPATVAEILLANMYPQIGFGHFIHQKHRQRVREVLEQVGMQATEQALIGTLSGGQLQRVLIARALINRPKLLLLDEPTTGMDTDAAADLYALLKQFNDTQNLTILMITHDIARAADVVKQIYCLEDGNLLQLERGQVLHELAHRHRHPDGQANCGCVLEEH